MAVRLVSLEVNLKMVPRCVFILVATPAQNRAHAHTHMGEGIKSFWEEAARPLQKDGG